MDPISTFEWASANLAFAAAGFWLWSASARLPNEITTGFGGSGGTAQELGDKLRQQSGRSAAAAACAAFAAISHGIALSLG